MTSTTVTAKIINDQRRDSRHNLPLATASTREWVQNINRLRYGMPVPGTTVPHRVPLYITASSAERNQCGPGYIRTVKPNEGPDRLEFPWVIADWSEIHVRGVVVNDYVQPGDMVWAPRRGTVTVETVRRHEDGTILGITARGSAMNIPVWFRESDHQIEADPSEEAGGLPVHPGDFIVVEQAVGTIAYHGKVVRVARVETNGRPSIQETSTTLREIERWIVVKRADSVLPEPGTLVIPREFLSTATPQYVERASELVGVAQGEKDGMGGTWLDVMMPHEILGMQHGHCTPVHQWTIVGHMDSEWTGLIEGWPGAKKPEVWIAKGETADGLTAHEWKAKWDALWEALNQEASRREWCTEYDEFASANGGPERTAAWKFECVLTTRLSENNLDDSVAGLLNTQGDSVDVIESVEIEHRAYVTLTMTADQAENDRDDLVEAALRDAGWQFESFQVNDWYED